MHTAVVWFRSDLRIHDNETLATAADADRVIPLYVIDPREFGEGMFDLPKIGPHRARFRRESLDDLRSSLRALGADLVVREGAPEELIPDLCVEWGVDSVHFQTKPATEELERENALKAALDTASVDYARYWTHTLYHINDLPRKVTDISDTFTPFKDRTQDLADVRTPLPTPGELTLPEIDPGDLPTAETMGVPEPDDDERGVLRFEGGETAGMERLDDYFWAGDHLRSYKGTRNGLLGANYSSKFSPWLAHGCLSPRYIHEEVRRYEDERVANKDTYWLIFELIWRDFFQFQFIKHGGRFFHPNGIRNVEKEWSQDRERFERWAAGETGIPFVDANMRELNRTGFMSNRGRQNVASFLADWLGIDWRLGAAYFESRLVDYDVCSNWGNWAYQAGVGNDSRDRYFNVVSQASRYDDDGAYVRHWLPELREVTDEYVHEPWKLAGQQTLTGEEPASEYPDPMLDVEARLQELR